MSRANFQLLTLDTETICIQYPNVLSLMNDLRSMGDSNAIVNRSSGAISRDVLLSTQAIYQEMFHSEDKPEAIDASFDIIHMVRVSSNQKEMRRIAKFRLDGRRAVTSRRQRNGAQPNSISRMHSRTSFESILDKPPLMVIFNSLGLCSR